MSQALATKGRVHGGALLCATLALGCTEQTHVLAGPAVAYPEGRPAYGGVATVGRGTGASIHASERFHTLGLAGRALITPEMQHLRGGMAFQLGEWSGPSRVLFEGTVPLALGVERSPLRGVEGTLGSGLALRLGYPLTDHTTYLAPWFFPTHAVANEQKRRRRDRTVLFAGPSADIDFRFTREPLPTLSFLVGIMWLSESLPAEQPTSPFFRRPLPPP